MEHSTDKENTPLNSQGRDRATMLSATKPSSSIGGRRTTNEIINRSISPLPAAHFTPQQPQPHSSSNDSSSSQLSTPSILRQSPSILTLMSPSTLFALTPPPPATNHTLSNQTPQQCQKTPPIPPNSEKLTLAIQLVESTLDEAIEDVRRVICVQDEEERGLERQLKIEEGVDENDGRDECEAERNVEGGLFTLEEDGDDDQSEVDQSEDDEKEKGPTDDIVSSLQSLKISCNIDEEKDDNEEEHESDDELEEEIVISRSNIF